MPKPKVSIIGEFWAMTTEGDGNYQLQRFLEGEGAEADIQLVAAWLLYMIWESRNDTKNRKDLRGVDIAKYGLGELGTWGVAKREATLWVADIGCALGFQTFAHAGGLYGYHLPDMDKTRRGRPRPLQQRSPRRRRPHGSRQADSERRQVEGAHDAEREALRLHAQRGRVRRRAVAHHARSSPAPSSARSRPAATARQLLLARADVPVQGQGRRPSPSSSASAKEQGVTREQVARSSTRIPRFNSGLHKPPHAAAGSAADLVMEIAPLIKTHAVGANGCRCQEGGQGLGRGAARIASESCHHSDPGQRQSGADCRLAKRRLERLPRFSQERAPGCQRHGLTFAPRTAAPTNLAWGRVRHFAPGRSAS